MNKIKNIPQFKTESEEQTFWANNSAIDYIDSFEPAELDLSNLKPSTKRLGMNPLNFNKQHLNNPHSR